MSSHVPQTSFSYTRAYVPVVHDIITKTNYTQVYDKLRTVHFIPTENKVNSSSALIMSIILFYTPFMSQSDITYLRTPGIDHN